MPCTAKPIRMMDASGKFRALEAYLAALLKEDVAIAFSGGVDSSLLLRMCREAAERHGTRVLAYTVHSDMHPVADIDHARRQALSEGVAHIVVHVNELEEAGIADNPPDRCYRCKFTLFGKIQRAAAAEGVSHIIEGTNEDDLHVFRPGLRALGELSILSPLALFHITKAEVRAEAARRGLSVARRPSSPCMATRFPYGTRLSFEDMRRVDEAESWLRAQGFAIVRLRVHGEIARLETDVEDLPRLLEMREAVIERLKGKGFAYITLDLEGFRSGSMDIHLKKDGED